MEEDSRSSRQRPDCKEESSTNSAERSRQVCYHSCLKCSITEWNRSNNCQLYVNCFCTFFSNTYQCWLRTLWACPSRISWLHRGKPHATCTSCDAASVQRVPVQCSWCRQEPPWEIRPVSFAVRSKDDRDMPHHHPLRLLFNHNIKR